MSTYTEQYAQLVQQSQEAVRTAVDNWTKTVQQVIGNLPTSAKTPFDPNNVVDQVFDFAEELLEAQRSFAKNLIASTTAVSEAYAERATEATKAATQATQQATKAATKKS